MCLLSPSLLNRRCGNFRRFFASHSRACSTCPSKRSCLGEDALRYLSNLKRCYGKYRSYKFPFNTTQASLFLPRKKNLRILVPSCAEITLLTACNNQINCRDGTILDASDPLWQEDEPGGLRGMLNCAILHGNSS